jgi:hypothetical protein
MIFCTLFNWVFLPQGIALYRSLEQTCGDGDDWVLYVLCMDSLTFDVLAELSFARLRMIRFEEIEDEALRAARANRTFAEFCWTCTTPLLLYVQKAHGVQSVVTYVDSDLRFFSAPSVIFQELGAGSIFIHEHAFAPEYLHLRQIAGRFNVGLIAVRNDQEGRACLERWRDQCLRECLFDPDAGKCGDQNYLDDWPELYTGLVVSSNAGVGVAPWNITKYNLRSNGRRVMVDDHPIVFYHYHSLRLLRPRLGMKPLVMVNGNYAISEEIACKLYQPYARELWAAVSSIEKTAEIRKLGHAFTMQLSTLPSVYSQLQNHQLFFSLWGGRFPAKYNAQVMSALYGIDANFASL